MGQMYGRMARQMGAVVFFHLAKRKGIGKVALHGASITNVPTARKQKANTAKLSSKNNCLELFNFEKVQKLGGE